MNKLSMYKWGGGITQFGFVSISACPEGKFGLACFGRCGKCAGGNTQCNVITGFCMLNSPKCLSGWKGNTCHQSKSIKRIFQKSMRSYFPLVQKILYHKMVWFDILLFSVYNTLNICFCTLERLKLEILFDGLTFFERIPCVMLNC